MASEPVLIDEGSRRSFRELVNKKVTAWTARTYSSIPRTENDRGWCKCRRRNHHTIYEQREIRIKVPVLQCGLDRAATLKSHEANSRPYRIAYMTPCQLDSVVLGRVHIRDIGNSNRVGCVCSPLLIKRNSGPSRMQRNTPRSTGHRKIYHD